MHTPQIITGKLVRSRLFEVAHDTPLAVERTEDDPGQPVLARCVATLKDDQQRLLRFRIERRLELHEPFEQRGQLALSLIVPRLAIVDGIVVSELDVRVWLDGLEWHRCHAIQSRTGSVRPLLNGSSIEAFAPAIPR